MSLFIVAFLGTYLLMNLYVFLKLKRPIFLPIILMGYFSPLLMRYADAKLSPMLAYLTGLIALLYMGFLVYLIFFFLLFDLYALFIKFSNRVFGINPLPKPSRKITFTVVFILSFSLSAYSYYETLNPRVYYFKLETEKLPLERVRIMHISDVHLGPVMGMDKIERIKKVYETYKPDILVSTGDLVDGNMKRKNGLAVALADINPPMGKFAVSGNHEFYRGIDQAVEFTQSAGFKLLRGEVIDLGFMLLAGVDDDDCRFFNACVGPINEYELLRDVPKEDRFVLLLKHKPRLDKRTLGMFDLMLSGHTHGGVYYPIGKFIIPKLFEANAGWVDLGKGSYLFVSRGVGTGGPPMRLLAPPDMAIIDIVKK
ncbi:metallophosphoesterase [Thermocrinis sp.]